MSSFKLMLSVSRTSSEFEEPSELRMKISNLALRSIAESVNQQPERQDFQRFQTLQGRWFNKHFKGAETSPSFVQRGRLFREKGAIWMVTSVFVKAYNKWRVEHAVAIKDDFKIFGRRMSECTFDSTRMEVDPIPKMASPSTIASYYIAILGKHITNWDEFVE